MPVRIAGGNFHLSDNPLRLLTNFIGLGCRYHHHYPRFQAVTASSRSGAAPYLAGKSSAGKGSEA